MLPRLYLNYDQDCTQCSYSVKLNPLNLQPERLMFAICDCNGKMLMQTVPCRVSSSDGTSYLSTIKVADVFCHDCLERVLYVKYDLLFPPEGNYLEEVRKKNIAAVLENAPN